MKNLKCILLFPWLVSFCWCEISIEKKNKLLLDFINYYNIQPNKNYTACDGVLQSIREIDSNTFSIVVTINTQKDDPHLITCSATVHDLPEGGVVVMDNKITCENEKPIASDESESNESEEAQDLRMPIKLENEVQADTAITSGEQFIAIPRHQPSAPCIGCSSHVNPEAPGVNDLANMGVRHLDLHEPTVKHILASVIDVERQVQVVNGVRYILTLSINFNNCTEKENDSCLSTKTCKVSILVKPWETLPSGAKYRSILANNCTEEWLFGDNGEILPELTESQDHNKKYSSGDIDDIIAERNKNIQSQPNQAKTLTIDEIKAIEDQILPHDHVQETHKLLTDSATISKDNGVKFDSAQQYNHNYVTVTESTKQETNNLSNDKKAAIDGIMDIFNFSGKRLKRHVLGGITGQNPNEPQYLTLAKESLQKYLIESGNQRPHKLVRVEEVTTQVVEGYLTRITFVVTPADNSGGNDLSCHSEIWDRPWLKKKEITVSCQAYKQRLKRGVPGGLTMQNPNEPQYLALAKESMQKYLIDSGNQRPHKVVHVNNVSTQVVAGTLTRIDFDITPADNTGGNDLSCHSEIWERPWLNEKEITVSCQAYKQRVKRGVPGGLTMQNPNEPQYLALAKESMQKYLIDSGNQRPHKVVQVNKVSTQVVAGTSTRIDFDITPADNSGGNDLSCHSEIWERPWLNEKEITVSCQAYKQRVKRGVPGGLTMQNPNEPQYLALAKESMQKYLIDSGNQRPHKVVQVNYVSTQVVAGTLTRIDFDITPADNTGGNDLSCHSEIWERPWLNEKEITVSCQAYKQRVKRGMPGGLTMQNPNEPQYLALAKESMQKYLIDSGNQRPHKVVQVNNVSTQVVAGTLTRIDFDITPADNTGGNDLSCHSEIWERPWLNEKEITVSCQAYKQRVKRGVPGGLTMQNPNEPQYLALAKESMQKYLIDSGNQRPHKVVQVNKVSTQVVAGTSTRIDFDITPADNSGGNDLSCHSEIWERPWLNEKEITVSCQAYKQRVKRGVPGGLTMQNPNELQYLALAKESMQKYLIDSGNQRPHKVVQVNYVSTQVVAGTLTRIDFDITPADNTGGNDLSCHSEIWERPWLNEKEITVSCQAYKQRVKRGMPGGLTMQNPNEPQYLALAKESMQKYLIDSGNQRPHKVVQVNKVSTQVVAGTSTRIDFDITPADNSGGNDLSCHSEIWERPWLNEKEITVSCQAYKQRVKRGVPGGLTMQNPNEPQYLALAKESMQKYLIDSGNQRPHKVVQVNYVSTQVVAGTLTRIDFDITPADNTGGNDLSCHSEIWERPWLNEKEITVSCQAYKQRVKRGVPGGLTMQNPNEPQYLALAKESMQKYLIDSGNQRPHKVVQVNKVSTQVVAGTSTRIDFDITPADNSGGNDLSCHSEIWERPWLNEKEITVSCQAYKQRVKRGVPGGLTMQNPNEPQYLALAKESMQKYLIDSGNQRPHKVVQVNYVSTQVVAGTLTRIDFDITPADNTGGNDLSCHSEIWERPWLNEKEITVSCQAYKQRVKRGVPGGLTMQNPNEPQYLALAKESMQKYLIDSGNQRPHKVVQVNYVSTQVVAGTLTRIDFDITPADNTGGNDLSCHSEIWERPWLNEKEITVSCQAYKQRVKRGVPGGLTMQNPNEPQYLALAKESMQKYLKDSGNQRPHKVVQVNKVSTQVVAGTSTRIDFDITPADNSGGYDLSCHSEIWERPWLNEKEITVFCQAYKQRVKRGVPGGLTMQNPNEPQYLALAKESMQKYLKDSGNQRPHKVVQVNKVSTQVVAGTSTRIDFDITPADNSGGYDLSCHSEIWERPWLNEKEITVSCQAYKQRVKRGVPGGLTMQNPNEPQYLALAKESMQKYLIDSGNQRPHKVVQVNNVSTQVVTGTLTRIDFDITPADNTGSNDLSCHSEIWERPWLNEKEITVSCQAYKQRVKRGVPGGLTMQNPKEPQYLALAKESMQKYLIDSGNQRPHKVVQVNNVSTQVVAGTLTRIDFDITPADNTGSNDLSCHSEIWERPWLNEKEITVSCQAYKQRVKRGVPGGLTMQNPNEPQYLALAKESMQKYLIDSGNQRPHKVVQVNYVSTQVVAGTLTRIDFDITPADNTGGNDLSCHSEIWERPWLNEKEITVSCQAYKQRVKRGVPGGLTMQNPNEPQYLALAKESMQKYLIDSGNQRPHKVVQVNKVSTQVVAGTSTKIDFDITPADNSGGNDLSCHSEIWERPWLNEKKITVSCQAYKQRVKRGVPGGITKQNPNEPQYLALTKRAKRQVTNDITEAGPKETNYLQLAQESLQKFLKDNRIRRKHKVAKIIKASTREMGDLIEIDFLITPRNNPNGDIFNCFSKIWLQDAGKERDIKVFCTINYERLKRQLPTLGVENTQNPTNPKYFLMAQAYLTKFLHENSNRDLYKVVHVENVTTGLIQHIWTKMYFLVSPVENLSKTFRCSSITWEHLLNTETKTNVSCQIDVPHLKRQIPDGFTEKNPFESQYLIMASKSLKKYLVEAGNQQPHKVVEIKQVLANSTYMRIKFEAVLTNNASVIMNCSSDVLKYGKSILKVICEKNVLKSSQIHKLLLENNMNKYQNEDLTIPGYKIATRKREAGNTMNKHQFQNKNEEKEENVTNPEYKLLAAQALRKYSKKSGILHKLVEVAHVTKRVGAGLKYKIKFSASPTECSSDVQKMHALNCKVIGNITVYCNAQIWDQPWIRKIKINVECSPLDNADYQDYLDEDTESYNPSLGKTSMISQNTHDSKVHALAEEALEQYLLVSKRKHFYKITKILSYNKHQENGIVSNIQFSSSPTVCLRNVYIDSIDNCDFKKPRVEYNCRAKIHEQPWLGVKKDIQVTCKKIYNQSKVEKRLKRQYDNGENIKDKDISYYYADRAIEEVNKRSDSTNLYKLVSIHAVQRPKVSPQHTNVQKITSSVKMFIEITNDLVRKLCQAKIFPAPGNQFMIKHLTVMCDDNNLKIDSVAELNKLKLVKMSIEELQKESRFTIVPQGDTEIIPSLVRSGPIKLYFSIAETNCTKNLNVNEKATNCYIDTTKPRKYCGSLIWRNYTTSEINNINVTCDDFERLNNADNDIINIESGEKLYESRNKIEDLKMAELLTTQSLRLIQAKYPRRSKQKIARIISFKKVAGDSHYRIKVEVGPTNCTALSDQTACQLRGNKSYFCSINVWMDQVTNNVPLFRVFCASLTGYTAEHLQAQDLYGKFLDTYNPVYVENDEENRNRFEVFKTNIRKIHNFNVFEKGTATYGITRFADLTYKEFSSKYTGLKTSLRNIKDPFMKEANIPNTKFLSSYDWRESGSVTEVKDQDFCSSSWAYSVTGNIESQIQIKTDRLMSLSEKRLLHCDQLNKGCEGGLPENAYRYLSEKGGSECLFNTTGAKVRITGAVKINSNETDMAKWLVENGPISIGINAAPLQFYQGGVMHHRSFLCNEDILDHSVLIVGYGDDEHPVSKKKLPYWIIKNSWGPDWGEGGYFRLYRGNGTCGVNKMATSAVITVDL